MVKKRWLWSVLLLLLVGTVFAFMQYTADADGAKEHKGARFVWKQSI